MAFWVNILIFWGLPPKDYEITSSCFTAALIIKNLHSAQFSAHLKSNSLIINSKTPYN